MIIVENIDVWGFEHAIRGMRNPMNSWEKSDSYCENKDAVDIGHNDLDLMNRLYEAGYPHRKYLRQIFVSMDITAPLYWWGEMDTYKIGTVRNSCSKMHKIHSKEIELSDFSFEDYEIDDEGIRVKDYFINVVADCEMLREKYLKTKDKKYWRTLIQLLPESYNQKATLTFNYENAVNMIHQRTGHKLEEWNKFCDILQQLPYLKEIMNDA